MLGTLVAIAAVAGLDAHLRGEERSAGLLLEGDVQGIKHGGFGMAAAPQTFPEGGAPRILVLGDSVTHGTVVRRDRAWPAQAEALLRARGEDARLLNLAVPGYDVIQSASTLRHRGWALEPDLVVYAAYINDHVETRLLNVGQAPVYVGVALDPRMFGALTPLLEPLLPHSALVRRLAGARAAHMGQALWDAQVQGDLGFFERGLDQLAAELAAHDVPGFIYLIPPHVLADPERAWCETGDVARETCAQALARLDDYTRAMTARGLWVASALPALQASGRKAFWASPRQDDPDHPGRAGHIVLAVGFVEALDRFRAEAASAAIPAP